jgi:hypothetical protein
MTTDIRVEPLEEPIAAKLRGQCKSPIYPAASVRVYPSGCAHTEYFLKHAQRLRDFEIRGDDVWIISYPKCGKIYLTIGNTGYIQHLCKSYVGITKPEWLQTMQHVVVKINMQIATLLRWMTRDFVVRYQRFDGLYCLYLQVSYHITTRCHNLEDNDLNPLSSPKAAYPYNCCIFSVSFLDLFNEFLSTA